MIHPLRPVPSPVPRPSARGWGDVLGWGVMAGALLVAVGTAVGAILNTPAFGMRRPMDAASAWLTLLRTIGVGPLDWLGCALSTPLFVWLARRFTINRDRWKTSLPLHLGVATALVLLVGLLYYGGIMPSPPGSAGSLRYLLISHLFTGGPPFGVMIAVIHALEYYRRFRERDVAAARLHAQLTAARLETLTAQLHPHFLFNTLQGISTLIHRDAEAADAMLTGLSDLLRLTLQRGRRQEVPLSEEMEMLAHYVTICRERYKDRLVFETQIPAEAARTQVPFFILQPLVENALQHGLARRPGKGHVRVWATREGPSLHLHVQDDGPGLDSLEQPFPEEGIGLSNVRQRLQQLYGGQQRLTLACPPEGGLLVTLTLPYHPIDAP